jgi:hypothetical protein
MIKKGKWVSKQQATPAEIHVILHNPTKLLTKAVASTFVARLRFELAEQAETGELNIISAHEVWARIDIPTSVSWGRELYEGIPRSLNAASDRRVPGQVQGSSDRRRGTAMSLLRQ